MIYDANDLRRAILATREFVLQLPAKRRKALTDDELVDQVEKFASAQKKAQEAVAAKARHQEFMAQVLAGAPPLEARCASCLVLQGTPHLPDCKEGR